MSTELIIIPLYEEVSPSKFISIKIHNTLKSRGKKCHKVFFYLKKKYVEKSPVNIVRSNWNVRVLRFHQVECDNPPIVLIKIQGEKNIEVYMADTLQ